MRIGIATPVVLYHCFAEYFDETQKQELLTLKQDDNAPIPSVIAQGMIQAGHFVRFFTPGPSNNIYKSDNVEIITINCDYRILAHLRKYEFQEFQLAYKMSCVIKGYLNDLDVLHAQWTYYTALAAGRFAKKIPVFCSVRDWCPIIRSFLPDRGGKYWKIKHWENELVFKNKNIHFIGNSPYTKALIEARIGKEVPFIMNPINNDFLLKGEKKYPKHLRLICITSSIDKRKNITRLLEAFKQIKSIHEDAELIFIFGSQPSYLKEWTERKLLNGVSIHYMLSHDEIFRYIDEATMMVNPSLEETFGNTIIESMARKTPILAGNNSGAIPYLLDFGKRGYVCDVTSADCIVENILYVLEHLDEASQKAQIAFEWVEEHDTLGSITKAHIDYYANFLKL